MLDLYAIGPRVRYGDFLPATVALVRALVDKVAPGRNIAVSLSMSSGATAAVACERDGAGVLYRVQLSMPAIPPDHIVTGDYAKTLLGFLLHECAHMSYTDTVACGQAKARGNAERSSFLNVAEDYFIEYRAASPRVALVTNVGALLGRLNDDVQRGCDVSMEEARANGVVTRQAFLYLLSGLNRKGRQGMAMQAMWEACQAVCHPHVRGIMDSLMDGLELDGDAAPDACVAHTAARMARAEAAWAKLVDLQQQQDEEKAEGEKGEGEKAEGEKAEGENETPVSSEGDESSEGENETPVSNEGGESEDGNKGKPGKRAGGKPLHLESADPETRRRIAVMEAAPDLSATDMHLARNLMAAMLGDSVAGAVPNIQRLASANDALRVAQKADVALLADAARRALRSVEHNSSAHRLQVGRFDRRAVVRAAMGARDVFARRTVTPGVRTAVTVMIDMSTSMDEWVTFDGLSVKRDKACMGVCSALVPAFERAGVAVSVALFASNPDNGETVSPVKAFTERMPTPDMLAERIGRMVPWGGTPMLPPAYWVERLLLAQRDATRRVAVWLCDGVPDEGAPTVRAYLTRPHCPVEHVGIGLGVSVPTFARAVTVNAMGELPAAFMRLLLD